MFIATSSAMTANLRILAATTFVRATYAIMQATVGTVTITPSVAPVIGHQLLLMNMGSDPSGGNTTSSSILNAPSPFTQILNTAADGTYQSAQIWKQTVTSATGSSITITNTGDYDVQNFALLEFTNAVTFEIYHGPGTDNGDGTYNYPLSETRTTGLRYFMTEQDDAQASTANSSFLTSMNQFESSANHWCHLYSVPAAQTGNAVTNMQTGCYQPIYCLVNVYNS